jgi:WD40-like Beta Propeller Repeat
MSRMTRVHYRPISQNRHKFWIGISLAIAIGLGCAGVGLQLVVPSSSHTAKTGQHIPIGPRTYAPDTTHEVTLPSSRIYYVEKRGDGFMLASSDIPGAESPVTLLPDNFGSDPVDTVGALEVAPSHRYIAIDAHRDMGDVAWIVRTSDNNLQQMPVNAMGNFLHWLPDGEHFLFRPTLPDSPSTQNWEPGVWIVDAATGSYINLPLPDGVDSTGLIDAAPSPKGDQIILSVTSGLGTGSSVWMTTPDGMNTERIFNSDAIVAQLAWSPDGSNIAYDTILDAPTPYRPADLWVMSSQNDNRRQIAVADGGHGYGLQWSPDGQRIAFVQRLNANTQSADNQAGELVSAIAVVDPMRGDIQVIANPDQTSMPRNIAPNWQSDGSLIFASMRASDQMGAALAPAGLWRTTSPLTGTYQSSITPAGGELLTEGTMLVATVK